MQLQAVIVPPPGVMDGPQVILDDIFRPDVVPAPARSLVRRLRKPEPVSVPSVEWQPHLPNAVVVRVCKFGNVTLDDAQSLITSLERAAATWTTPVVRVADIHVGETEPFSVAAGLAGDLDALDAVFGHVLGVAERQGFFLDRRSFRCQVALGTLTVPPGATIPESLPGVVIPVNGPAWTLSHLQLQRVARVGTDTVVDELAAIPLGSFAEGRAEHVRLTA